MGRIVRFALASAMRQEEISRIRWSDVDVEQRIVLVRDRKDPREKDGNDQWVPLLNLAGFDALRLIRVQRKYDPRSEEHTSELQSLMRISYAVFCLKKKKRQNNNTTT